ncbi:MAG: TauD/TfdA family dioxygenase [Candidatus Abawacabacteria bacterium]|nr:TauD/TfdA family dioxygenase [Candidatus Abawacabacteria bacterium]
MSIDKQRNTPRINIVLVSDRPQLEKILTPTYPEVAPGLSRGGIRIDLLPRQKYSWKTILRDSGIQAETFRKAGFVLFKNFSPLETDDQQWGIVSGDSKIQMIHRDHPRNNGVAYFHASDNSYISRQAFTVTGNAADVFNKIVEFIQKVGLHPTERDSVISELIAATQKDLGLSAQTAAPTGKRCWSHYFFSNTGTSLRGIPANEVFALYEYLKDVTYRHHWEKGDLLLLSEDVMVHGRMPFSLAQQTTDSKLIVKALTIKQDGRLNKP